MEKLLAARSLDRRPAENVMSRWFVRNYLYGSVDAGFATRVCQLLSIYSRKRKMSVDALENWLSNKKDPTCHNLIGGAL